MTGSPVPKPVEGEAATMAGRELIGSRYRIRYDNGLTFVVDYEAANRLVWQAEHGQRLSSAERPAVLALGGRRWMVNWLADNGVTVSQVLDLQLLTVATFMTLTVDEARRAELMTGRLELLRDIDDKTFTTDGPA